MLGLSYSPKIHEDLWNKPIGYVDAAWASEKGSKSRGGHVIKVNGAAISYQSKLIHSICLSSAEAETTAAIACLNVSSGYEVYFTNLGSRSQAARKYSKIRKR